MKINTHAPALALILALTQASCAANHGKKPNSALSDRTSDYIVDFRVSATHQRSQENDSIAASNGSGSGGGSDSTKKSDAHAKAIVESAMGTGTYDRYRLSDSAEGFFTSTEHPQTLHVIVNRKVTAADKNITPSFLVIFQDNKPITQFVPSKAAYSTIESVFEPNDDDLNQVILSAAAYQMGSQFISADVYGFENPGNILKQEMGVIYENACSSAIAEARQVKAAVIRHSDKRDELRIEHYVAPCEENGTAPDTLENWKAY